MYLLWSFYLILKCPVSRSSVGLFSTYSCGVHFLHGVSSFISVAKCFIIYITSFYFSSNVIMSLLISFPVPYHTCLFLIRVSPCYGRHYKANLMHQPNGGCLDVRDGACPWQLNAKHTSTSRFIINIDWSRKRILKIFLRNFIYAVCVLCSLPTFHNYSAFQQRVKLYLMQYPPPPPNPPAWPLKLSFHHFCTATRPKRVKRTVIFLWINTRRKGRL